MSKDTEQTTGYVKGATEELTDLRDHWLSTTAGCHEEQPITAQDESAKLRQIANALEINAFEKGELALFASSLEDTARYIEQTSQGAAQDEETKRSSLTTRREECSALRDREDAQRYRFIKSRHHHWDNRMGWIGINDEAVDALIDAKGREDK